MSPGDKCTQDWERSKSHWGLHLETPCVCRFSHTPESNGIVIGSHTPSVAMGRLLDFTVNAMEDTRTEGKSLEDVGACEEWDRRCPSVTTRELNVGFQNHSIQAEHPKPHFKVKFSPLTFGPHLCHLLHSFPPTWVCGYCLLSLHVPATFPFVKKKNKYSLEIARPTYKKRKHDSCWRICNLKSSTMLGKEESTLQKEAENYFSKRSY